MNSNGFEQWGGYMEAKITKLEEQFSAASNSCRQSHLFDGISIYVNGLTSPSANDLKRIMMLHGGTFHHYERSHTTYIIASNLADVKVRNMNTSKIISPQWVLDCVKEQKLLDYTRYLLYTNQKTSQPRLMFKNYQKGKLSGTTNNIQQMTVNGTDNDIDPKKATAGKYSSGNCSARSAVDPKFLSEFYNNSRLHHISTLGAGFKQYVNDLREQHGQKGFPARLTLKQRLIETGADRATKSYASFVMHIDMDCFFVSVSLRKHPELRGQPVAVTHSKGGISANEVPAHPDADRKTEMELFANRFEQHLHNNILSDKVRNGFEAKMSLSEIASCSYEARAKGIHNGMFVGQALNLCPELKTIPYDFEEYRKVAYTLYDTIAQYTLDIEAVSCDEMFVDLTDVLSEIEVGPMDFVLAVREEVSSKTGCPCSAGIGGNKLQARMATKRAKPNGQYELMPDDAHRYMTDILIKELPGVGSSTAYTLNEANLVTCGDIQRTSLVKLQMLVGKKFGETLYQFCRGIDNRPLVYGQLRKSVSAEVNYGIRFKDCSELEKFLQQLCTEVYTRLNDIRRRTKCLTLKLMVRSKEAPLEAAKFMGHGVCDHITKSVSLSEYTCELEVITRTALTTMKALSVPPNELRGIGIQLSKLDDPNEGKEPKINVIKNMFNKLAQKQKDKKVKSAEADNGSVVCAYKASSPIKNAGKRKAGSTSNTEYKKVSTVMCLLQNNSAKISESSNKNTNNSDTMPEDIDPHVFAALPPDIRAEIMQYHHSSVQNTLPANSLSSPPAANPTNLNILTENDLRPSTSKATKFRKEEDKPQHYSLMAPSFEQLDPEFLAALPSGLRTEIETEYGQKSKAPTTSAYTQHCNQLSHANPGEPYKSNRVSVDNIFMQANCTQLLLSWVKSVDVPETYDIELISKHACELVHVDEIDKLYNPLIYLCRLLNQQKNIIPGDCPWHLAYQYIIKAVQTEVQKTYGGRKLYLGIKLKCDNCAIIKK